MPNSEMGEGEKLAFLPNSETGIRREEPFQDPKNGRNGHKEVPESLVYVC